MKVYQSKQIIAQEQARAAERSVESSCWDGLRLDVPFEWSLLCDDLQLWFVCRIPGRATFDPSHVRGAFVEGLWEYDVAEFFLMDGEGRYQEFNVGPTGAWWRCGFTAYRTRATQSPVPTEVLVETHIDPNAWEVLFSIALRELLIPLERIVGAHVSAIVRHPTLRYISSCPVLGAEPDFHRRECFQKIEWVRLD